VHWQEFEVDTKYTSASHLNIISTSINDLLIFTRWNKAGNKMTYPPKKCPVSQKDGKYSPWKVKS
jgi:hypothetical protein